MQCGDGRMFGFVAMSKLQVVDCCQPSWICLLNGPREWRARLCPTSPYSNLRPGLQLAQAECWKRMIQVSCLCCCCFWCLHPLHSVGLTRLSYHNMFELEV